MKKTKANEQQIDLQFHAPVKLEARGEGSYFLQIGRPEQWLKSHQLAKEFHVDVDTIYRWLDEGTIPRTKEENGKEVRLVRRQGKRRWNFHAALIPILRERFDQDI